MTLSTTAPVVAKDRRTADELKQTLAKAIEGHPECKGFVVQTLIPLPNSEGIANWDAEFFAEDGRAISPDCKRALISAKQGVQKRFDLAGQPHDDR